MNKAATCIQQIHGTARHGLAVLLAVLASCWMSPPALAQQTPAVHKKAQSNKSAVPAQGAKTLASAPVRAPEPVLSAEQQAIAQRVERGVVACELGVRVSVTEDARLPGHFDIQASKQRFRMIPVVTSTGAIRLEDRQAGAVWLQLPHKSMLMSQKLGSRLADACVTPAQAQMAMALEKAPPPALLDAPASVLAARGSAQ